MCSRIRCFARILLVSSGFAYAVAACSSSTAVTDGGHDTSNVSAGSGGAGGSATGSGGGGGGGVTCTPLGGNAATIAAGPIWACFQSACMAELGSCSADCSCNNAILTALTCVQATGSQSSCFATAALSGGSGALMVALCLQAQSTAGGACAPSGDGGALDAPAEAGNGG